MRRTETVLFGDILKEFFERPYIAARIAEGKLPETWRAIVGSRVANLTSDLRLENHILYVKIESSLIRHEIFQQRDALRDEINRRSNSRIVNAVIVK